MVKFGLKINQQGTSYWAKPLREIIGSEGEAIPNNICVSVFTKGSTNQERIQSLKLQILHLELEREETP